MPCIIRLVFIENRIIKSDTLRLRYFYVIVFIYRYYAIAAPLHYGTLVNSRKIMLGLCGIWIVCLLISIPPVFWLVPYTSQPGLPVCTADFSKGRTTIFYTIFYTTITLVLPSVIILGCNIKVSREIQ